MTENFRQKLLNWITSISYLLLFSALAPAFIWFVTIPLLMEMSGEIEVWWFAGALGETLIIY